MSSGSGFSMKITESKKGTSRPPIQSIKRASVFERETDDGGDESGKREVITNYSTQLVKSDSSSKKSKVYSIAPLKNSIKFRDNLVNSSSESKPASSSSKLSDKLREKAIQAIEESINSKDSSGNSDHLISLIPLKNLTSKSPIDDELDLSSHAPESTLEDYSNVPIADFGLAMLRGMGWKEGEGIGLSNKKVVEVGEPKVRPRGLGLGADRSLITGLKEPPSKSKSNYSSKNK